MDIDERAEAIKCGIIQLAGIIDAKQLARRGEAGKHYQVPPVSTHSVACPALTIMLGTKVIIVALLCKSPATEVPCGVVLTRLLYST